MPSKPRGIYLEPNLVDSQAFLKLNGIAIQVYLLFLKRRVMKKVGPKGKEKWFIENNGEIIFTYTEALKKYGITKPRFQRAIDCLTKVGFIDINHHGGGVKGDFSKYEICERWRDYGTDKFIPKVRPKDTRKLGFGSKSWKEKVENKKKKTSKSGNETINALSNKNVNGQQHYDLV